MYFYMNKDIKYLVEYTTLGFNIDNELYTDDKDEVLTPDMIHNYTYYTPKSREELREHLEHQL